MEAIRNINELKFDSYFKSYKKLIMIIDEERKEIRSYKEFLEGFLIVSYDTIEETEEFFISFIKFIAIIREIQVDVFYNSEKLLIKEKNTEKVKKLYLDDFESIINIIEELNIARILKIY